MADQGPNNDDERRLAEAVIDAHLKIISAAYDKAVAYTNLIIIAGYATYFGLWQITKGYLTKRQALCSALFMLTSVVCFVMFEVWKGYFSSRSLFELSHIMNDPANQASGTRLLAAFDQHNSVERRRVVRFGRVWHVVMALTVLCGLAGEGVLAWAFLVSLFR
jgi:hypothetical protein